MKTILKRLSACAVAAAAVVGLAAPAWGAVALPDLPADQCVVDDANVLSEDTTAYMEQLNGLLEAIGIDRDKVCTYCWNGKE